MTSGYRLPLRADSNLLRAVTDTVPPNYISPSDPEGPWVSRQIALMLSSGVAAPYSPSRHKGAFHSSPIFLAEKGGGSGRRLIVDMRRINLELNLIPFSLSPAMLHHNRDILAKGSGLFVIDFTSSFQHIEIHPDHHRFFGIVWEGQRLVLTAAPYGCASVPEMFQTVAGITKAVAARVGLSPALTTPAAWKSAILSDTTSGTPGSTFDPATHYRLTTRLYLDDKWGVTAARVKSMAGTSVDEHTSSDLNPRLVQSLAALDAAFGWAISPKSHMVPSDPHNVVLGFHVHFQAPGNTFVIPDSKVDRYHGELLALSAQARWSARQVAKVLGKINHLWLVWRDLTGLISRPLYDFVATRHAWDSFTKPGLSQRSAVALAMASLKGPDAVTSCPVYPPDLRLAQVLDSTGSVPGNPTLVFTDASDHATGMWLTEAPRTRALKARQDALFAFTKGSLARWQMLPEDAFDESSTYRELLAILAAYSRGTISRLLASSRPLIHHIDSQAAWHIIRAGSSRSPKCHALALEIWKRLAPIRQTRPVVFAWIPREENLPGDFASKGVHDWRVCPNLFLTLDSVLHFTLDLFASESERVRGNKGLIPFASFFQSDLALGDGRSVPIDPSGTTWVFPPIPLMRFALSKCKNSPARSVLLLPRWAHSTSSPLPLAPGAAARDNVFGESAIHIRLPPGQASRRCPSLRDGAAVTESCRHSFTLVFFNIDDHEFSRVSNQIQTRSHREVNPHRGPTSR